MYGSEKYRAFMQHPGFNGKSKAPPPPDYTGLAQATAQGNLEAARQQTSANRVNQFTPYGSLTYAQTPQFNESGYNQAMQDYQSQLAAASPMQRFFMQGKMPTREQFTNRDIWTATQTLSPDQQKILEQNTGLTQGLLGTAQKGLGYVNELLSNPTIDESKLAQMPISGQSVQDAIMSRLQPQLQQQRSQLENQLANQGITRGSEAFNQAMQQQRQAESDQMNQAALQGMQTALNARQQGMQEQAYIQDRPLNVVNALRMGNQVTGPQFVNPAQQAFAPGADLMGAAGQQYQAQLGDVNARNAQTASNVGAGIGLAAMMF